MFHVRKLSNTLSTPVVFSPKPTKISDTTPTPPKPSTKPSHRRGRSSVDKSQVSKPVPILAYDERQLFEAMASGDSLTKERRVPKAAEKKVKIDAPELIKSSPQRSTPAPVEALSRSWYTPPKIQLPLKGSLQRSISSATPRTPSRIDAGKTNPTKQYKNHGRSASDSRKYGIDPEKRHVDKQLIKHPECPWVESTNTPTLRRPARPPTRGSCDSDKTAVGDEVPARVDDKRIEHVRSSKPADETVRPTVRIVSKPLPDLPVFGTTSSRWSASTGSVYSDCDPLPYDQLLDLFPQPPKGIPDAAHPDDWEDSDSLSDPRLFMSCPNTSSSSVETIVPVAAPTIKTVKPLTLKAVPTPKTATVVHQNPHASFSFSQVQDSLVVQRARACPQLSMKGSIHAASVRTAGHAPAPQRRSSFGSSDPQNPLPRICQIEALVRPWRRQTPEEIERIAREERERDRIWELEKEKEQELRQFEIEFGFNPHYKGKKMHERPVDPNGFELIKPEKKQRKWL